MKCDSFLSTISGDYDEPQIDSDSDLPDSDPTEEPEIDSNSDGPHSDTSEENDLLPKLSLIHI